MEETPTLRRYTDFDEMKADEYRYWQSRAAHKRLDAVEGMIETAYALKGGRSSRMYQDYKDLLFAFHAHGVKYLVVGTALAEFGRRPHPASVLLGFPFACLCC
jgi:hypothetical protein